MTQSTSTPEFPQPPRTNLLVPVLVAFLILGIVIALAIRVTPNKAAELTVTRTAVYPTHIVMGSPSLAVGQKETLDDLYVLATLRVDDILRFPLFIKDFTGTLTTANGDEITTSAIEKDDIPNLFVSFPGLKPLASMPLLREVIVEPDQSAEGMVILHFPVTQAVWDHRQSAVLNVDFYHQPGQPVPILRKTEIASPASAQAPAQPAPGTK
jgi:hypothetical protein